MEPQSSPSPEQAPSPSRPENSPVEEQGELPQPTNEKLTPKGETASQSGPMQPASSLPKPIATDEPAGDTKPRPQPSGDSVGPAIADDVDVIEKEWVDKAKSIVNEHKHDPYNQEKETSKLQADYLKKRYGKDVKLSP